MSETVAVRASGSGEPVWLFHSLLADAGSCSPLAERLSRERLVLVPDLPGFGGSAPAAPGLDAVADRMAASLRRERTPADLFGNGYGSFAALVLALRHPGLVRRLVLAGTGAAFSEPGRAAFRAMAEAASARGLAAVADAAMRRLFAPAFQAANPDLLAERRARFVATNPSVFTGACGALATLDLRAEVPNLTLPVLVLVGAEDEATPPAMARELAGLLPDARLVELDGCAHVPQLQAPDRVAEAMRDFL